MVMASKKALAEEAIDFELNEALEACELWRDTVAWEDTPFRPSDDVVLLGFGFHYSSDASSMYKVEEDGSTWSVTIDDAVPIWYHNGVRIGGRSYDDVVSQFGKRK
jgi:hypothetical protein